MARQCAGHRGQCPQEYWPPTPRGTGLSPPALRVGLPVLGHMLKHVPVRHMIKHVPKYLPAKHVLAMHVLGYVLGLIFFFREKNVTINNFSA